MIRIVCDHCKQEIGQQAIYRLDVTTHTTSIGEYHLHWWCLVPFLAELGAPGPVTSETAVDRVRQAWDRASNSDDYPQGFGWPGDLYDALEALTPDDTTEAGT